MKGGWLGGMGVCRKLLAEKCTAAASIHSYTQIDKSPSWFEKVIV